jgi:hypothetical protein
VGGVLDDEQLAEVRLGWFGHGLKRNECGPLPGPRGRCGPTGCDTLPLVNADRFETLIRSGDTDELLLEVDRLAGARDWDGLLTLRERCVAAHEHGRQLWGVAQFIEYRVALEAPGPQAASVCAAGAARFALGPLTEVVAQRHSWEELADHLPDPWVAATVAQERVLRGEDLTGDPRAHPEELGLPPALLDWEPDYPLPRYRSHDVLEDGPEPVETPFEQPSGRPAPPADEPLLRRSLTEVGETWAERSNGGIRVATVEGTAADAVVTLFGDGGVGGTEGAPSLAVVRIDAALERLAWTAASGGAYGRRSGMATGRSAAFWVLSEAVGLGHGASGAELTERLDDLRWYVLQGDGEGWRLRLAVEHVGDGWAAVVDAWDEEEPG